MVPSISRNIQMIESKIPPGANMDWVKEPLSTVLEDCDGE
jgi:hypothetical protein